MPRSEVLSTPLATHIQKPEVRTGIDVETTTKMVGKQAVSIAREAGACIQLVK